MNELNKKIPTIISEIDYQIKVFTTPIIYNSIDVRNSGFKVAPVDVNFFPAGFNNISNESLESASQEIRKLFPSTNKFLLIAENHDRNMGYLKNLKSLEKIFQKAEKNIRIANLINTKIKSIKLEDGSDIEIDGVKSQNSKIFSISDGFEPEKIIINNDMSDGYPEIFKDIDFDPWILSSISTEVDNIDIKNESDIGKIKNSAKEIFDKIEEKFDQYQIKWTKPYCFVKSNSGTYGMGVIDIKSPDDLLKLNKKSRDDMKKGKSGSKINSVIIQEGIVTIEKLETSTAEKTLYLVGGELVGGFWRYNQGKNSFISLNSKSSDFKPLNKSEYESDPFLKLVTKICYLAALKEVEFYQKIN